MSSPSPHLELAAPRAWARLLLSLSMACAALTAGAAPKQIEVFDAQSWAALQAGLGAPAVVVFSSTDCVHCPGVLKDLAAQRPKLKASVIAVVMDQQAGSDDGALLSNPHYRSADRLLAFAGQEQALRHTVNPQWRGMTPYIALLRPGQPIQFVMGPLSQADLQTWLRSGEATKP